MDIVRIGTRGSPLALTQSRWVASRLTALQPGLRVELIEFKTTGDIKLGQSLTAIGGKGAFTKELEDALLENRCDLAVHSLKDLPTILPDGLAVACTPTREATADVLIARDRGADPWSALATGATVGSSSPRRKAQLLARWPDLNVIEFRGNVDTRLRKLEQGQADAILLAQAGLKRLGLFEGLASRFGVHVLEAPDWLPAVGQGCLGIETRAADSALAALLASLHDAAAWAEVSAERAFLRTLGAGCTAPVGARAVCKDGRVSMHGAVFAEDGSAATRAEGEAAADAAAALGESLARNCMP